MELRWTLVVTSQGLRIHKPTCHIADRSTERILLQDDRQLVTEVRDAKAEGRTVTYCKGCLPNWPGPIRDIMSSRSGG